MTRAPFRSLAALLLAALFAWGSVGAAVADAVVFHRLAAATHRGELPAVGDAAGLFGHGGPCVLGQSLSAGRTAPPPCAVSLALTTPAAACPCIDQTPRQILHAAAHRSRAPPTTA
ncbi:MAG: hypothetical protein SGI84_06885 [Gemmatimonadota bacterium]|nr:hypothetical protein [Gemmatimonadota bacterium]